MNEKKSLFWRRIKFLLNLPKSFPLGWRLLKDNRLPFKNKLFFLGLSLFYLFFPVDIIPDVPLIGHIDDFTFFMILFNWFINTIPRDILEEYGWEKE